MRARVHGRREHVPRAVRGGQRLRAELPGAAQELPANVPRGDRRLDHRLQCAISAELRAEPNPEELLGTNVVYLLGRKRMKPLKQAIHRPCARCGASFSAYRRTQLFCSIACRTTAPRGQAILELDAAMGVRFWGHVERRSTADCWPWLRAKDRDGYGVFRVRTGNIGAHRVALALSAGGIDAKATVCHRCDNPSCCNPAHLFVGSSRDNTRDMMAKGRQGWGDRGPNPRAYAGGALPESE